MKSRERVAASSLPSSTRTTTLRHWRGRWHPLENTTNEPNFDKTSGSHNNKSPLKLRQILALIRDLTRRCNSETGQSLRPIGFAITQWPRFRFGSPR